MMSSELSAGAAYDHPLRRPRTEPAPAVRARVFLLSDVRLYREGLLWSLTRQQTFEVLGAADLARATVAGLIALRPDVIILDIGAPDSFGLAKSLGVSLPNTKIVAFAVSEIDHLVLACAEVGIAGYVAPDGSQEDLVTAIEYALRGELYCSPRIAGLLLRRVGALSAQPERMDQPASLTRRERQILALVSEGMSNKEIGRALRIGDSTVKNHVHNILEKLQVRRRGEAAVRLRAMQSASVADPRARLQRAARVSSEGEPAAMHAFKKPSG
jgi:two-component system nitrate/nitrite response regulator NarL